MLRFFRRAPFALHASYLKLAGTVPWRVGLTLVIVLVSVLFLDGMLIHTIADVLLRQVIRGLILIGSVSVLTALAVRFTLAAYALHRVAALEGFWRSEEARRLAEEQLQATRAELEGSVTHANDLAAAAEFREARTLALMDAVLDGVIVFNESGLIQSCNPAGHRIFGARTGALVATQIRRLVPSLSVGMDLILGGTQELDGLRHDGTTVPLEVTISPIISDEGALFIAVMRDVTQHKEVAAALAEARDAALQAARVKSEFLATMSHEIRTPMNGVIGMTDLLLDTQLTTKQRGYAEALRRSGEALLMLINDILDFSKIEAGKLQLEQIDLDVRQVIQDVTQLLGEEAARKEIGLGFEIDTAIPLDLLGDPNRLRQILLNLVGNAVKFTHSGEVLIRAHVQDDGPAAVIVRFEVSDTGIGIDQATRLRLFAPFVQADGSTTRKYGGTGLGLAICRQLVERMGGTIDVESSVGRGSTFHFVAGFSRGSLGTPEPKPGVETYGLVAPSDQALTNVGPLLIAEDSIINQQVALGLLEKLGVTADVVSTGVEAIAALDRGIYAAVLMDCQMPDMDGFEATAEIRRREASTGRHTPVIAMTANAMQGDRERCLAAGMDDYVSKPVRVDELKAALVRQLGPSRSVAAFEHATLYSLPGNLRDNLLLVFLEEAPMRLQQMRTALASADAAAFCFTAHALKGDAATVGALEVADICRVLEQHGRDGIRVPNQLIDKLGVALARAEAAVHQMALLRAA